MMKKKYLIPNTSVVEVKTEGALLTESWHTGEESLPIIGPDDEDKIIGIAAVRHRGFPLPVFSDRRISAPLDTVIPVPPIFSGFPAQVALMQVLIELIQHDVR